MIMGTSICHIVLGDAAGASSRECAAWSRTASSPACTASRPASRPWGTSSPGSWRTACPPATTRRRARRKADVLRGAGGRGGAARAGRERPARARLVERESLGARRRGSDGLLVGVTLATRAPEIYRALIEATAFGTRVIVDAFESAGVAVDGDRRLRRPARAEQAADADLRRRHRARAPGRGVEADPGARRGDVRSRRSGGRARRATTRSSTRRGRMAAPETRSTAR